MWQRLAEVRLRQVARRFPIACILGARQVGKTTLARRAFARGSYFDLERPADLDRLRVDPEFVLERAPAPAILDEAQAWPPIFPLLRSLADRTRTRGGRFVVVGSAQPALVRGVSESLAGRVGFVELDPLTLGEVGAAAGTLRRSLEDLWLRGGFPGALRSTSADAWRDWMEGFVRTFVERDIAAMGVQISPPTMRTLLAMLAHAHGGLWNASEIGASLGASYHTVNRYVDVLEQCFVVRRLPPYFRNIGKRLTRSPKVYLRDSGMLHYFLGVDAPAGLDVSPKRGPSFEGFVIEQIVRRERLARPGSQFYFWRTARGAEVDLLIDRGRELLAFEIKLARRVGPDDLVGLRACMADLDIRRGYVLCMADAAYDAAPGIRVEPVGVLLRRRRWLA